MEEKQTVNIEEILMQVNEISTSLKNLNDAIREAYNTISKSLMNLKDAIEDYSLPNHPRYFDETEKIGVREDPGSFDPSTP